ncbi:MAG: indole-3-glycerol phosphate synthase TrpC [Candidatus Omnitrophica bacterium]|nr:indole-3-glycerol phosphate synthase TrpC [Candidatus Omnitrophota bacterium]MBU4590053.1 indole-3-glycerol phosphate synthase TrpC [Candidatus Omnitrophota bacterium]
MKGFLNEVVNVKKKEVEALKARTPITHFVHAKRLLKGVRAFKDAVSAGGRVNLIAEIKKKSPSNKKGFLKKLNVASIAKIYEENGAKAISVLTDKKYFGGDGLHIAEVRRVVNIPVLRKDFIIDEYQIYESRYLGADAILLIARILTKQQIQSFMHLAKRIGMECLVEVHCEKDLEKALVAGAKIIGINNRDLDTFKVSLGTTFKLASKMPDQVIKVSESGIGSNDDIARIKNAGVNAVLIGTSLLGSKDIGAKIKEIMGENKG